MKAVADSSFLVALFYPRDTHHEEAVLLFEKTEELLVHHDILKETLTVLAYRLDWSNLKKIYGAILENEPFRISYFGLEDVFGFWLSTKRKISYFDAVAVLLALKTGYELLTFDKEQKKLWKHLIHTNQNF